MSEQSTDPWSQTPSGDSSPYPTTSTPGGEDLTEWQDAVLEQFAAEFPPHLHFTKGRFTYVPGYAYVERANSVVREWDCECLGLDQVKVLGKEMLIARVCVSIPGLGRRCHVGVQLPQENMGEDAVIKGAVTDGIKKALSLFGMGLYMGHKEEVPLSDPRDANRGGERDPRGPAPTGYGQRQDRAATVATKDALKAACREADLSEANADTLALAEFNKPRWSYLSEGETVILTNKIRAGLRPAGGGTP